MTCPPFGQIVRLMWIDDVIDEEGEVGRHYITAAFGISQPRASLDIRAYMTLNPGRIAYDRSAKRYMQIEGSKPLFSASARAASAEIVRQVGLPSVFRAVAPNAAKGGAA